MEANAVYSYIFVSLAVAFLFDAYTFDWLMFEASTKVPLSYALLFVAYFALVQQRTDEKELANKSFVKQRDDLIRKGEETSAMKGKIAREMQR